MQDDVKVVLIGGAGVGKTCLVYRVIDGTFDEQSKPTLGASYSAKVFSVQGKDVRLQMWDTAGQERYRGMTPIYYRGAAVAVVVYSVVEESTFDEVDMWFNSVDDHTTADIIKVLVANKKDLEDDRVISPEKGMEKAKKYNAMFYETSAATGENVDEIFADVVAAFLKKGGGLVPDRVIINPRDASRKKGCC